MVLKIYNTLGREKQEFKPLKDGQVSFYYCGPTVYKEQHIGNLRGNLMADLIRRSLGYLGYEVNFVSNYTDVGHLTSDADGGEDKVSKQAKLEQKTPEEIISKAIEIYEQDSTELNILPPTLRCRATDYISEMIDMIRVLTDKGFTYKTDLAIYFDISKANNYTQLSGQNLDELRSGAGTGDIEDPNKKNPSDFAVWFFKVGEHENTLQTWDSPWGEGFPGWHIECSAMAKKNLGDTIDIHMGGIEHVPTHHTNEIAQSESANEVKFTNYWMHNEHLGMDGTKMSKSLGNVVLVKDVKEKGFNPLALRYFFLQAHYRSKQNFTWEALESAQKGYKNLLNSLSSLGENVGKISEDFKTQLKERLGDDFNIPQALALVSEVLKSDLSNEDKLATILDFDKVLGLDLKKNSLSLQGTKQFSLNIEELPQEIQDLISQRNQARENKDWAESDRLRDEIEEKGYEIKDTNEGIRVIKK
ncbi:MAG: cysteine--tRNA ligase [Patescibacteria group bacterium]